MPSRRLGISKCSRCSSALRSTSGHSGHSKLGVSVCRASLSSRKKRVESEPPVAPRARLRSIHLTQNTKSQLLHEVTYMVTIPQDPPFGNVVSMGIYSMKRTSPKSSSFPTRFICPGFPYKFSFYTSVYLHRATRNSKPA